MKLQSLRQQLPVLMAKITQAEDAKLRAYYRGKFTAVCNQMAQVNQQYYPLNSSK